MALILKPNAEYISNSGVSSATAYLRINPFDRNDKDAKTQIFYVFIYYSKDKTKEPLLIRQVSVSKEDYDNWFSPVALKSGNLHNQAYSYLLDKAKKYTDEQQEAQGQINFSFRYLEFNWLQGDIWVSDEP